MKYGFLSLAFFCSSGFPLENRLFISPIIFDSAGVTAFAGQSTPHPSTQNTGILPTLNLRSRPALSVSNQQLDSASLSLTYVFDNSSQIASMEYLYYPVGMPNQTSASLNLSQDTFRLDLSDTLSAYGSFGVLRTLDFSGNFRLDTVWAFRSQTENLTLKPNRWYILKAPRRNTDLISRIQAAFKSEEFGVTHLIAGVRQNSFYDLEDTTAITALGLAEAYLVNLSSALSFSQTLDPVQWDSGGGPITHTLEAGWNLIANPFVFPISVKNAVATNAISPFFSINDSSFGDSVFYDPHDPALPAVDSLVPLFGYWVWSAASNNDLVFHPYIDVAPGLAKPASLQDWVLSLSTPYGTGYLGEAKENYRFGPPPMAARNVTSDNNFIVNIKKRSGEGAVFDLSARANTPVSLLLNGPGKREISGIFVPETQEFIPVDPGKGSTFVNNGYFKVFYLAGSTAFVEATKKGILDRYPGVFSVSKNYPNPFNPTTAIRYAIPLKDYGKQLTFSVYSVAGRLVFKKAFSAVPGKHKFVWNAKDAGGKPVGSGQYVARMALHSRQKTIKMVVLR